MNKLCNDCPLRLYNDKCYNLSGIGNPFYGNCIVIPNVDYDAYKGESMSFSSQVEIIEDILHFSTGVGDSNIYIVPLIRCNEQISCKVDEFVIHKCVSFLFHDIAKYNLKNILLLGSAANRLLNCHISENLDNIYVISPGVRYFVNFSPLNKYVNEDIFEVFKTNLIHWHNSVTSGMYDYNMIVL